MSANSFGQLFKLTSFGESHGPAIGGIIEGCPAGLDIDIKEVQAFLDRRRPGSTELGTARRESDQVEFLSGIFEGKTTGTPIGFIIRNEDSRPEDYAEIKDIFRPSHADFTYTEKYGFRDYRGGGRSSARETACRIVAGAIANRLLSGTGLKVEAFVSAVGDVALKTPYQQLDLSKTYENEVRCPDPHIASFMAGRIEKERKAGDSVGGVVSCVIRNCPPGLGEPVFNKLHAALAFAMMGINAVKGFEYGSGFAGSAMKGSEHNDEMEVISGKKVFKTNHSGGIQGGISNGEDIFFNVAFKPVASIGKLQQTVNQKNENTALELKGRHDPCVVPRAVPIVEAMAWMVLADFWLMGKTNKL